MRKIQIQVTPLNWDTLVPIKRNSQLTDEI